jgi:hypothetical protein
MKPKYVIVVHKTGGDNSPFWADREDADSRAAKLSEKLGLKFPVVKIELPEGIQLPEGSFNIAKEQGRADDSPEGIEKVSL